MNEKIAFLKKTFSGVEESQLVGLQEKVETIKHYVGYGGEHLVVGELLLLGINAVRTGVDSGWDILAMNQKQKTYLVQVKTAHEKEPDRFAFHLGENLLENMQEKNRKIFVFVLLQRKARKFVVMSAGEIERELKKENIWKVKTTKRLRFRFYLRGGKLYLGNLGNEASRYLENWSLFGVEKENTGTKQIIC